MKYLLTSDPRPHHVIATSRSLGGESSKELEELAAKESCLTVLQLNVDNPATFPVVVEKVDTIVQEHGLNVLINNAGIFLKKGIDDVTTEDMLQSFGTNTIGPLMLTKAFLPLLKRAASHASDKPPGWQRAVVINMSSLLASISDNQGGSLYGYRSSQTALNAITKSLSIDLVKDGIITCSVDPGWMKTDMGGPDGLLTVEAAADNMLKLLGTLDQSYSGGFLKYVQGAITRLDY